MEIDIQEQQRVYRAVRFGSEAVKVASRTGLKRTGAAVSSKVLTKGNVVLAVADAVISVLDAAKSYAQLQQAKENLNQLGVLFTTERKELESLSVKIRMLVEQEKMKIAEQNEYMKMVDEARERMNRILMILEPALENEEKALAVQQTRNNVNKDHHQHFELLRQRYERTVERYENFVSEVYGV